MRVEDCGAGPGSNSQDTSTTTAQVTEDVQRLLNEQKIQIAKDRLAENKEAQLYYIRKEEELQQAIQMERREAQIREEIRRTEELRERERRERHAE